VAVRKVVTGMKRGEVETLLKPAADSGIISMYAGGQISQYENKEKERVSIWYDYTGSKKDEDGWLTNRKNLHNKVISVIFEGVIIVGPTKNSVTNIEPRDK
jgi:hypothetical protein